ncbi:MAG: hypothetical protein HOP33_17320 [Verrucomicrobia bacterium]|nr:hypothetical protein [Verrucomicrobiota bacterium]
MKTTALLLTALLISISTYVHATQTAQATLFCWSLRFQQGHGSFDETLDFSTISGTPNGELAPWFSFYTHSTGISLDPFGGFPIPGTMDLDLPPFTDANGNGFDDSFEVSQAAGGTSSGEYTTAGGGGTVSATWSRAAGSSAGTCWLHLVDDTYGNLGTFQHTFEVLEYTGPLTYTPGSNAVTGNINLTQTGNPTATLLGPVQFQKSVSNPFNELTLQAGGWTNDSSQTLTFGQEGYSRDLTLKTNYYGYVSFADGDLNTAAPDYTSWLLSIDDVNDADADTIPDFSDNPSVSVPRRPLLTLSRGTTNLLLTISGDVGRLHHILERTNLSTGGWVTNRSLTLTNDPQTISMPLTGAPMKFWRALVP